MRLLREDDERKANVIDLHLKQKEDENEKLKIIIAEFEAAKAKVLGTLTDDLNEKEAEIYKQREDKKEEIKLMKELLATKDQELSDANQQLEETKIQLTAKSQEVSDLEQRLKKTIIEMDDKNVVVNSKQLKIVELIEQLELAKAEVSYHCKYFILLLCCSSF